MSDTKSLIGLRPVGDYILVFIYDDGNSSIDLGDGRKLITGLRDTEFDSIHRKNLDEKHPGIRGRWAVVVGVNDNTPDSITLGDKVFLDELKWSRGILAAQNGARVWKIPPADVLVVDSEGLSDDETAEFLAYLASFDPDLLDAMEADLQEEGPEPVLKGWM